jgi:hypothetical protein
VNGETVPRFIQNGGVCKRTLCLLALLPVLARAQVLKQGLVISDLGVGGRTPFPTDALQRRIVLGDWKTPKATETVATADGRNQPWTSIKANKDGWFEGDALDNGYVYIPVESKSKRVVLLTAQGDGIAYINGRPRAGDPYQYGYLSIPIELKKGQNDLLFACGRGRLRAEISEMKRPLYFNTADLTTPDIVRGRQTNLWAGVVVVNGTSSDIARLKARTTRPDGQTVDTDLPSIPAMSLRKVPIKISSDPNSNPGTVEYKLELIGNESAILHTTSVKLRVRQPLETHKRTFISEIDGSVQYYAVVPAQKPYSQNSLILSLHGASVEALGQAEAYSSKIWGTLVAPTNRRPFGFDWEDWGRLDFLEVFERAKEEFPHDPARISLTGHSMGGHGTWYIGSTFPGSFASLGPSAGWISFWTYTGAYKPKDPNSQMEQVLRRAQNSSDTEKVLTNLAQPSIYVLHGDKDDNVPVTEARSMKTYLSSQHDRFQYFEQPGAGHWWDGPNPGADCVDWPPMFELFRTGQIPKAPLEVDFTTVNPAYSSDCRWIKILQQEHSLDPSRVRFDSPMAAVLSGHTDNVKSFQIDFTQPQLWGLGLTIDGQTIPIAKVPRGKLVFKKTNGQWLISKGPNPDEKSPRRGGPFKQGFQRRMMFVYGTAGTAEENAWARAKAKYDAEAFYYRGNGAVDIVADSEFSGRVSRNRNVVIYGNADTNRAWKSLVGDAPVQVRRGALGVGGRLYSGADIACMFIWPRRGTDEGLVSVISGTGPVGMRSIDRLPIFLSGCEYPDYVAFRPDVWANGPSACLAAGFFDNDWKVDPDQGAFVNRL